MEKSISALGSSNNILRSVHTQVEKSVDKIIKGKLLKKQSNDLDFTSDGLIDILNGHLKAAVNASILGYIDPPQFFQMPSDLVRKPEIGDLSNDANGQITDVQFYAIAIANAQCFGDVSDKAPMFLGLMRAIYFCLGVVPEVGVDAGLGIVEVVKHTDNCATLTAKINNNDMKDYLKENVKQACNACIISLCCTQMEFYQRNHHYLKANDEKYERLFRQFGLEDAMTLCGKDHILHTVTHPLGIARPYLLLCIWNSKNLLPTQLVTRMSGLPAGTGKFAIALKAYEEALRTDHGFIIADQLSTQISHLEEARKLIKKCPVAFHTNASLYGVASRKEQLDAYETSANAVLEICAPLVMTVRKHSILAKSPILIRAAKESSHGDIGEFAIKAHEKKLEILAKADPMNALDLVMTNDTSVVAQKFNKLKSEQKKIEKQDYSDQFENMVSLVGRLQGIGQPGAQEAHDMQNRGRY